MKNFKIIALIHTAFFACALALVSCTKTEDTTTISPSPVDNTAAAIPEGSRIRIHFGTSTQNGCLYSFSNCIWIGWGTEALGYDKTFALSFSNGDAASRYFGGYFPLTSDYTVDAATAKALGIPEQVIPAGFYPLRDAAAGQADGRRVVAFSPEYALKTQKLVNEHNPQDNLGQLHNLAAQVILNDNREAIGQLRGDKAGIQRLVTEKAIQFLAEAGLSADQETQRRAYALDLSGDYSDPAALLEGARLSDNDKKALRPVFEQAASLPVTSPETLGKFVSLMTEHENRLSATALDDPKMVLSAIAIFKYSRYYWFWKSWSSPETATGAVAAGIIPSWVIADVRVWLQTGSLVSSIVASVKAYLK